MTKYRIAVVMAAQLAAVGVAGAVDRHKPSGLHYEAPQALWSTPGDGRLVMLIRNATDQRVFDDPPFITPIPFRVRVCVTNFVGDNAMNLFVWTTAGPGPNGGLTTLEPQLLHPGLGDCVEIDRPAAIIAQDATTTGSASGYYQLLEAVALPASATANQSTPPDIDIGDPKPNEVRCKPIQSDPSKPDPSADYLKICELDIAVATPSSAGVRICTNEQTIAPFTPK